MPYRNRGIKRRRPQHLVLVQKRREFSYTSDQGGSILRVDDHSSISNDDIDWNTARGNHRKI